MKRKFGGNGDAAVYPNDRVEGSESVSGCNKVVSDETSIESFTKFGSPRVKTSVIQYGRCSVVAGGLKGFSRLCSDVVVEPKYSDGMFEVVCCDAVVGVL